MSDTERLDEPEAEDSSEIAFLRAAARTPAAGPGNVARLIGAQIGRYRVHDVLGYGGMGVVLRATDRALRRDVALKVMRDEVTADRKRRKRFLREARLAASISHPNVATIHDVGEHEDRVFIAMELLPGATLRDRLRLGPLPIAEVIASGAAIASGVAKAHAAGIVHRDLKPENVAETEDGILKVLDFGLAKACGASAGPATSQSGVDTEPGHVLGTPPYMSPEQARGLDVGDRSDVFSFGVLLYELTTGALPFAAETLADVLEAHLRGPERPMSERRPDTPEALEGIVARCLEVDVARRPPMSAVVEALRALSRLPAPAEDESVGVGEALAHEKPRGARGRLARSLSLAIAAAALGLALYALASR